MESVRIQRKESESEPARKVHTAAALSLYPALNNGHTPALYPGSGLTQPSKFLQPKLAINQPGDQYEQEADRVAEHVMRMPEPAIRLQRKCGGGASGASCEECSKSLVQRSLAPSPGPQTQGTSASVQGAVQSGGRPLDNATHAFMESRFNQDFGQVRIHTGLPATESARELHAHAYTLGRDIVWFRTICAGNKRWKETPGPRVNARRAATAEQCRQGDTNKSTMVRENL
jgi:hypothetical protein